MVQPLPSVSTEPHADAPAPAPDPGASRRFFLAGSSALALAATAGATTAWNIGAAGTDRSGTGAVDAGTEAGTVIAYIRPGESEITVISGDREVVVDDPALARAIARTLGGR